MANTKLLEREIHNLAQAKARRITLVSRSRAATPPPRSIDAVAAAAAAAVEAQKGCKFVRCALAGAGGGALTYDLVYDDKTRDNEVMAANRSAILRALIERLGGKQARAGARVRPADRAFALLIAACALIHTSANSINASRQPRRHPRRSRQGGRRFVLAHLSTSLGSTPSPKRPRTGNSSTSIQPRRRRRRSAARSRTASFRCRCCRAWRPKRCSFPTA